MSGSCFEGSTQLHRRSVGNSGIDNPLGVAEVSADIVRQVSNLVATLMILGQLRPDLHLLHRGNLVADYMIGVTLQI